MPDATERPRSGLLEAFVRAVLAAILLGLADAGFDIYRRQDLGLRLLKVAHYLLVYGAAWSLPTGPACIVEVVARRFRPSWRVAGIAGISAFLMAYVSHMLATAVPTYFRALMENPTSPLVAFGALGQVKLTPIPPSRIAFAAEVVWALLFALLTVLRLRLVPLARQIAILVVVPSGLLLGAHARSHDVNPASMRRWLMLIVVAGTLLPLASALARSLSDRLFQRVTREPLPLPPNPVAGVRHRRRSPALLLAFVGAAVSVVWIHRAFPDAARPTPTREEDLLARDWADYSAGKLSRAATTALMERATSIREAVRARAGEEDPLCVEYRVTVLEFPGSTAEDTSESTVWVDGDLWPEPLTSYSGIPGRREGSLKLRGLRAGSHEIMLVTCFSVLQGTAPIWSHTWSTSHRVTVVPGSVRGEITLVHPTGFDPDFFFYQQEDASTVFHTEKSPVAIRSKVQVFDEGGVLIETQWLYANKGDSGSVSLLRQHGPKLSPGRHTFRIVVTPDPDFALDESATVDEILGETWQREFSVEKESSGG